jgi:hypothetical protein
MARVNLSYRAQQQMNAYKAKFKHDFTINTTIVDIEEMGANYDHGLVPLIDIAEGVKIVIGNKIQNPTGNKYSGYSIVCASGELVAANLVKTHWMFQRNTYCNNAAGIYNAWFEPCARSGKGVRLPEIYGGWVLPADSGHTSVTRIIRGEEFLPFEIADIPDQGTFAATLQLAMEVAGEIFLSLNSKNVKKPSKFDIYRIAVVQKQEPEYSIHNVVDPLGFKVKQASVESMTIHNLNDIHFLWNLDKSGQTLNTALTWWKKHWADETVDPCLSAAFGLLMKREKERLKRSWTVKQQDQLAAIISQKWSIVEFADDFIKEAYAEITGGEGAHDSNHQVMYGLAYLANKYMNMTIPVLSGVDFAKAKNRVL